MTSVEAPVRVDVGKFTASVHGPPQIVFAALRRSGTPWTWDTASRRRQPGAGSSCVTSPVANRRGIRSRCWRSRQGRRGR